MGNSLFPADNPWNQKITNAPVAANSATLVASIGASSPLHPDFGTMWDGYYNGIPYNVVTGSQPKVSIVIDAWPGESDLQPIPIPAGAVIEGDPLPSAQNTGDRHLIVYDQTNNILYETFATYRPSEEADGQWHAASEAVWDLNHNTFRTAGFTSADAAGLPILPGLVRPDEVLDQGVITHALRFTVSQTDSAYVYPASHEAGVNNPNLPPMGERFRLKASFDISGFSKSNQVILQALKDYGMIVADNGGPWFLSGAPSPRWNDDDLHALTQIPGSDFEAVDLTPQVTGLSVTSGPLSGGIPVTITGLNFSGGAGMTKVVFGSMQATNVQVVSDTQITAVVPAGVAGSVNVTVVSPYGTSAVSGADVFTYTASVAVYQNFVSQLYVDLLQRQGGSSEISAWVNLLVHGMPTSQVVSAIDCSSEHLGLEVNGLYTRLLGRNADPGGLQGFVRFLQNGGTLEQVATMIASSGEYAARYTSSSAFVQSLYAKILGRTASQAEVSGWLPAVASVGRAAVSAAFLQSAEFRGNAVEELYGFQVASAAAIASDLPNLLRRPAAPPPAEVNGWVNSGLDVRTIELLFAQSEEFFNLA
jgi:hypothetical protein